MKNISCREANNRSGTKTERFVPRSQAVQQPAPILSQMNPVHNLLPYYINIIVPSTLWSSEMYLLFRFTDNPLTFRPFFFNFSFACYVTRPRHQSWQNNSRSITRTMKIFDMRFFPASYHVFFLMSEYSRQHIVRRHLQFTFLRQCE